MTPETETKAGAETETAAAEPRARLSPEQQRALIERRRRRAASPATEAIPPRPHDGGPIPLSLAQGRLWFLERLHPGSPVYNLPVAIRLEGRLDTAALERALGELVRRHEALRTVFAEVDGRPVQVVQEAGGFSLPTARVRPTKAGKETEDQDASVRLLAQKEARRPFDLAAGPLVRGVLLRLAPRHHVLLLTMHHLVFDGWSRGIFFRELDALYAAFAEDGSATPVPEPPRQYGDFAVWQRGHLDGPALDGQIAWWRGRLAGAVALPILTDRPHPAGWTDRGARLPVSLPGPLVDALAALGRSEGATLFMTLLAAYQALLARYTGEPDVVVGAPISGRPRPETEGIVGFFANTLVLRTDLDGDPTFRELLRRVRETALGAFAHQEVPFERLVAEVNAERTINRTPLTPVMIALQDALPAPLSGPRLRSSFLDVDPGTAMFDLFLNLQQGRDAGGEVRGAIEYATDFFDAATIARFAGHLRTLLEGAVADPDCRVSALPLLAEPERRRLLGAHDAAGEAPPDDNATIHGRFEAWAARTPEAPALLSGGHHLTYRDLDRRANRLAHRLHALGVGPGVAVGLCLARSPGLVVGLLAILKAGGIAVPLDPAYPPERLAFMLDDSRAPVLVGDEPSVARLATVPVRAVLLDRDRAEIEREPDGAPVVDLAADAPAYVVYTSGSTGTPKGVVGLHRGAVNLARWLGSTYPFAAGETGCHVTSFSFVDAVWDLFGPLLNGAPTRLVDEEDRKDPRRLIEVLAEAGAARVIVVASMLRAILETGVDLQTALPDLRFWFSSAELLPPELAARFYRQAPHATLINTYGSSEVTAVVTWHEVARSVDRLPRVPIGRPIANARVLVLDGRGEPVPVGVPGELCVGGAPVARGYLRRPELTAERFVPDPDPDPVAARPDARLFRTGDRGRVLANGDLEFLGRIDRQVKIRGFRVEPGEVEAALGGHPAVREVAVVAGEDGAGGARLVAYVVPQAGQPPTADELRVALRQRLPDYMAPSVFVPLDALPRTATGKVDRRALPAPELGRPGLSAPFAAPRTPVEAALAASWEAVLGVDPVGVRDNFFDLGGHSLLVAHAMNRLRDAFGLELPLRTLFEAPTVAELAERVEAARRGDAVGAVALAVAPSLVALQPEGAGRPVFLIPGGAGEAFNLFRFAKLARRVGLDRPFYGFYAAADDGEADPKGWVEATAAGYLAEVRAVQPDGPYLLAGACAGAMIAWEMASQLVADGGEVARLLVLDAWVPGARRGVDLQELERRDQRASGRGGGRRGNGDGPGPAATATAAPSLPGGKRNRKGEVNPFKVEAGAVSDRRQRLQQYRPRRYPGRVVLFVNEEWHAEHPTLGWDAVAGGGLEVVVLPGGHGTYLTDHMGAAVERLREFLDGV